MHLIPLPDKVHSRFFVLGKDVLCELPELLKTAFPGKKPCLVADDNTWRAAGEKAFAFLKEAGLAPEVTRRCPGTPRLHALDDYSCELAAAFPENCVPVAVGSGVINDLVKRGAGLRNLDYCCVATAASVDGSTSSGAALLVNGRKMTQPCPAPYALLADTRVLESAPPEMLASGYGDLWAKVPAGAEWHISHVITGEPIPPEVWSLVQPELRDWVRDPGDLLKIFKGLASTGFALQLYGDSRPGSGAEHMLSHVLDMEGYLFNGEPVSHGFQVAVGTVATTKLLEYVTARSVDEIRAMAKPLQTVAERQAAVDALLVRGCYGNTKEVAMEKFLEGASAVARREKIFSCWQELQRLIAGQIADSGELIASLHRAGCPALPEDIGLDRERFRHTMAAAQLIRKRYTVLDYLYEAGVYEDALAYLCR